LQCAKPPEFEVVSIDVVPKEIYIGEPASITATIKNIGGCEGIFPVNLMVNGSAIQTKLVAIKPGENEIVNFTITQNKSSEYNIQIGTLNTNLIVKKNIEKKNIELKYDDGIADFTNLAYIKGGYIIDFMPPAIPFTIKSVKIYAHFLNRDSNDIEGETIDLQILTRDLVVLYSKKYPLSEFPRDSLPQKHYWKEFAVPDITIQDMFYIHINSYSQKIVDIAKNFPSRFSAPWGLVIAMNNNTEDIHSTVTTMENNGTITLATRTWLMQHLSSAYLYNNFMIRINGTYNNKFTYIVM